MSIRGADMEEKLRQINEVIENGHYKNNWASLQDFHVPKWFKNAKFGIFVHWGVYSVPAYLSEWYSRNMYIEGSKEYEHHIKTYGNQKDFGYKDFIPMFGAKNFIAGDWLKLFKKAGVKYLCQVAEHHDGFQMYKSDVSKWNSFDMGPKRDVLGELAEVCDEDFNFCTSSHRAAHWFFMSGGTKFNSDIKKDVEKDHLYWPSKEEKDHFDFFSEPRPTKEFCDDWLIRTVEIVDKYKPSMIYFDWWIQHDAFKENLLKFLAYYYNRGIEWNKEVAVAYKHDALMHGSGIVEVERGKFKDAKPFYWQSDTSITKNSWCYTSSPEYKTTYEIITNLIDIVSKNGNLMLNIGPKANGDIPDKDIEILLEIGNWLEMNGEGIYGSKTWTVSSEGDVVEDDGSFKEGEIKNYTNKDIRYTTNNGYIYAFVLQYVDSALLKYTGKCTKRNPKGLHSKIEEVKLMGFDADIDWANTDEGLKIRTGKLDTKLPVCFRIKVK